MGKVVKAVTGAVRDVGSGLEDAVRSVGSGAEDIVRSVGSGAEDAVRGVVTAVKENPLEAAALVAAGFYFAPQMGAWLAADGTAIAGTAAGAQAGAATATGTGLTAGGSGLGLAAAGGQGLTAAGTGGIGGALGSGLGTGSALGAGAAGAGAAAAGAGASSYLLPAAIAGSSVLGALASKKAADTQAAAQMSANQLQYKMFQEQQALQEPWRQTGINALNKLNTGNILGNDPGYAFRLGEGQKALERQAAARGGLISGSALKAATRYGQDMGSQEYNNAFNRYATLAGYGQNATNTLTSAAGNYGANAGAGMTSAAAANAAGTVGTANALASGVGQYLNYSSNQDLTNAIRQSSYR